MYSVPANLITPKYSLVSVNRNGGLVPRSQKSKVFTFNRCSCIIVFDSVLCLQL